LPCQGRTACAAVCPWPCQQAKEKERSFYCCSCSPFILLPSSFFLLPSSFILLPSEGRGLSVRVVVARLFIRTKAAGGGSRPLPCAAGRPTGCGPPTPRPIPSRIEHKKKKRWHFFFFCGLRFINQRRGFRVVVARPFHRFPSWNFRYQALPRFLPSWPF